MKPPDQFFEDYDRLRARFEWAQAGLGKGDDIAQGKLVAVAFRDFYEKWHLKIQDADLRRRIEAVRRAMKMLQRHLDGIYLEHLQEVIQARKDWWVSEQLFKRSVQLIKLMEQVVPPVRTKLAEAYYDKVGKEFEPATEYRQAEADADNSERKFRTALSQLQADWPERINAAVRARLEQLDGEGANAWHAEVASQIK